MSEIHSNTHGWWYCHKCRSSSNSWMMMTSLQALVSLIQLMDDDDVVTSNCVAHPTHGWWCCHKHLCHSSNSSIMMLSQALVSLIQLMDDDDVVTSTCVAHPTHGWWCCHKHLCRSSNSSTMMLSQALVLLIQLVDDDVVTSTYVTHPTHQWWCDKHLCCSSNSLMMDAMMLSQAVASLIQLIDDDDVVELNDVVTSTCVTHPTHWWWCHKHLCVTCPWVGWWCHKYLYQIIIIIYVKQQPNLCSSKSIHSGINLFMISNFTAEHHNFLQRKKLLPPDSLTDSLQFDPAPLQPLSSQMMKPIIIIIHHHPPPPSSSSSSSSVKEPIMIIRHHAQRKPIIHVRDFKWQIFKITTPPPPPPYILTCTPTLYTSSCPAGQLGSYLLTQQAFKHS